MLKIGIPIFPGSNCDRDIYHVLTNLYNVKTDLIWHKKDNIKNYNAIIIPGGFSFGDRLRAGIIAAHSPIIKEVKRLGNDGVPVLGICNGFQILVECELLPGSLIKNEQLSFSCKWIDLEVKNIDTPFTSGFKKNEIFKIPIANGEGRFILAEDQLKEVKKKNQIIFSYSNEDPNGSLESIAGVSNDLGNIVGMMPHPERTCQSELKSFGLTNTAMKIFDSLIEYIKK
jgi:phosphoribosylformylglycinamidine synthase subunit PurQ / glutaminase